MECEVAPVVVGRTSDALVFVTRHALVVGFAPAALRVGKAVETVLVLRASSVGVRLQVLKSEHL